MTEIESTQTHPAPVGPLEVGHTHSDVSGGWLRASVFGAMDGLVTNIALVAGVGGAGVSTHVVVLSGMASLVAGAFSMALGEYTSVGTQNAAVHAEVAVERAEMETNLPAEKAELVQMYRDMGLTEETARRVTEEIHANQELAVRVHLTQELGIDPNEQPSPIVAALSSFLAFAVGAVIPLLPFFAGVHILWVGLGVGAVGLFVAGAVVARFTRRSWWWNGIRQLIFGALAAAASYGVGALIGVSAVG
ncbi:MAG TPA: VIT1/CCC1 transporter family protein [Pseudonocardiaceae bacterium]